MAEAVEGSVITEEMRNMLGVEMGPRVYEIEKGWIRKFAEAIDDPNPLWQDEAYARKSRYGGIVCPPTFLLAIELTEQITWAMTVECPLKGFLNGANDFEYYQPIRWGDVISVTGKLVDLQEREAKTGKILIMVMEQTYTNQFKEVVAEGYHTFVRN